MKTGAFFDIDGTLVGCQTQKVLAAVMAKRGLLTASQVLSIFRWFLLYRFGAITESIQIRKAVYRAFSMCSKETMDSIFGEVWQKIATSRLREKMHRVVEHHRHQNSFLVGVPGSLINLCMPICEKFKIDHCYATNLKIANCRYSGEWDGNILEGWEKVNLLKRLAQQHDVDLQNSSAYADSYSDLPMLEVVGHPVAVYPDRKLRERALRKKWEIIES